MKPVQRFVAVVPNDLWQIDIMGKVRFPLLGDLYLILALDDHSRFILAGGFFPRKFRIHLFTMMHAAFTRWGLPQRLLSDRESHFKLTSAIGESDYQYYARRLGIELVYARRAQGEGRAALPVPPAGLRPGAPGGDLGGHPQHGLRPVDRGVQLQPCESRPGWRGPGRPLRPLGPTRHPRGTRTGTISYYGRHYRVPDPYIGRRVWTQLTSQVGQTTLAEYTLDYELRT